MVCEVIATLATFKQDALTELELPLELFSEALADLTAPAIVFRNRAQPQSEAIEGLGELTQADAEEPMVYAFDAADDLEPGTYIVELDAEEGTWPIDRHFFVRVIEHAG